LHGRAVIAVVVAVSACSAWVPAAGATASAGAPVVCAGAQDDPATASVTDVRAAITCLLDAARTGHELPALRRDVRLQSAAQRFAATLSPSRPLSHRGRGGTTPLQRIAKAGYGGGTFTAAEALGRAYGALATPAQRVQVWLSDKTIKKLLLSSKYRDVGVGVSVHGVTTTYVVELARAGGGGAHTAHAPAR
jgi:uncharacterized protein YkwD